VGRCHDGYYDAGTGGQTEGREGRDGASRLVVPGAVKSRLFLQKKSLLASEAGREDVLQAREDWKMRRQPHMRQQIHRLVFLDETGTTTRMTRLRGRARRGARLKATAPFGH